MKQFTTLGQNLYQHANASFYGDFWIAGRRVKRRLQALSIRAARNEIARKQADHHRARMGLCADPFTAPITLRTLIERYRAAGCPDRHRQARTGKALASTLTHLIHLERFFGTATPERVTLGACDRYHDHRISQVSKGLGHRTVELELGTLTNLLTWATRCEYTRYNPLATGRPSYRQAAQVRHCATVMPESDEEIHHLANHLLEDPQSEVLAWQLLLEALTGCRTSEILRLRWDAQKIGPRAGAGYQDDISLYVDRCKHGIFPYVLLDVAPSLSPLRDCLRALRHWHDNRYADSPWFLPGRDPSQPVDVCSLTHALHRVCKLLDLPQRTSHGLRAYHVRVLRSLGIDDSEIAKRLGQRSGVGLVERVYGRSEPGWFGAKKLDFLPADAAPAWSAWLPSAAPNIITLAVG